jgi:hypothetical protein
MKSGFILRPGAAEFPHENALINRGALWMGTAMCGAENVEPARSPRPEPSSSGRAKAIRSPERPRAVTIDEKPPSTFIIPPPIEPRTPAVSSAHDEPFPPGVAPTAVASAPASSAPTEPPQDERIETFLRAISEVARVHGAAETAAHAESLFKFGTPAPLALSADAQAALLDGNILEATEGVIHATAWFASTSSAWQRMLRGEEGNLAVCGESTLDGWTADLIARLVAKPAMASTIRRDLRRRGIAAFGMLDA